MYPEEVVEGENVEVSLIFHIQQFKDVLQSRWLLPVLQRQDEVQVGLIVLRRKETNTVMRS